MVKDDSGKKPNRYGVLIAMLLGSFSVILNNIMLNVSLPTFMHEFNIDAVTAQNVVVAYMIPMMITISLCSYLSDLFGRKWVYAAGIVFFLIGSILGTFSWSFNSIIFSRIVQGSGAGLVMPLSIVILFSYFSKKERGFVSGLWGVAVMLAPAIGPTIGGLILQFSSWEMLFSVNIPSGLFCLAATFYFVQDDKVRKRVGFDTIGFITISIGIIALVIGVNRIHNGWGDGGGVTIALLAIGMIGLVYFIWNELHTSVPLIDIRILTNKVFTSSIVLVAVCTMCLFSSALLIPLLLQEVLHFNALTTGMVLFPQGIMMGIAMTIGGRILDRYGVKYILPIGLMMLTTVTFVLGTSLSESNLLALVILLIFRGIGIGFINTPAETAGLNALENSQVSRAMSINNFVRQLTGTLTITLFTMFFESRRILYLEEMGTQEAGILAIKQSFLLMGGIILLVLPILFSMNSPSLTRRRYSHKEVG